MPWPSERKIKSASFWLVGLGLIIWNAVWGPESLATSAIGLTLCGIPTAIKLDRILKVNPAKDPEPEKEPVS